MKKIAIIGATGFASERMLPELRKSKKCKVTSILGRNEKTLKEIATRYKIKNIYLNIDKLIKENKCDAFYIATPPYLHLENIKKIAKTDSAILCEKPLASNLKESLEIKNILDKSKNHFVIGHHIRHQKAIIDIKSLIDKKEIGDVVSVYSQWGYQLDPLAPYAKWKLDRNLGGYSAVNDPGIHIIDLLNFLFGMPVSVFANGFSAKHKTTHDNVLAMLFYNDKNIIIESSQTLDSPSNNLFIYGTDGTIKIPNCFEQVYIPKIIIEKNKKKKIINYKPTYLYKNEMENLLGLSRKGVAGTSLRDGIENSLIMEAINESVKKGKIMSLNNFRQ